MMRRRGWWEGLWARTRMEEKKSSKASSRRNGRSVRIGQKGGRERGREEIGVGLAVVSRPLSNSHAHPPIHRGTTKRE